MGSERSHPMTTSQQRRAALDAQSERALALAKDPSSDPAIVRAVIASLGAKITQVLEDPEALDRDPGLQSVVVRARGSVRALERWIEALPVPQRANSARSERPSFVPRRCASCGHHVMRLFRQAQVRDRSGWNALSLHVVICEACGHTQLFAADLDAVRRASTDDLERVEAPIGDPYREG
jgi:hypothetical protein